MTGTWRLALAVALAAIAAAAAAQNPAPSTQPQLRFEAGDHVAGIARIGSDAQGRYAVTASSDKTARVWDVASGRLLQVLRPPIGGGNLGQLSALGVSPDARLVAVGGATTTGGSSPTYSIYVFEREGGRMSTWLHSLPQVVTALAFSADGEWLAAGLHRNGGVRLWHLPSSRVLTDTSQTEQVSSLAWTPDGRLVVASHDGRLRLYGPLSPATDRLAPAATVTTGGGQEPQSVAVSPDGLRVAIGYRDSNRVEVVDGRSLQPMFQPETGNLGSTTQQFATVTWSRDGRQLLAAGRRLVKDAFVVRRWDDAGRGSYQDIAVAQNSVFALSPLPGGATLVGSSDASWGVLQADGRWERRSESPIPNFVGSRQSLRASDSARAIEIGFARGGTQPMRFDLHERIWRDGSIPGSRAAETGTLPVTGWINGSAPKLRDLALPLDRTEIARSLAIDASASRFVLGTSFRVRTFDADGKPLWSRIMPAEAHAVTFAHKDQVVVAAYTDGTIRWFRARDGRELLSLFTHADRKRWVLWTPAGYYDAAPGAEDLIGWHLNRGQEQAADFFPASRFRERFHRPDVIDLVLDTLDEEQAVARANDSRGGRPTAQTPVDQALPPVVDLLGPGEVNLGAPTLVLRARARSDGGTALTGWRVRIDGQPAPAAAVAGTEAEREFRLAVPERDHVVEVFAENRHGVSTAATVRVRWAGRPASAPAAEPPRARLYVLAVGVARYQHPEINRLELAGKDARDFAATMQAQQGRLYRQVEVRLLTDEQATRDRIMDGLEWLSQQVTQHDVGMVFVAGHGLNDPSLGYLYLPTNADPDALRRTGVPMEEFRKTLSNLAGKALFFFDTCHSGNVLGGRARAAFNDVTRVVNELASAENGVVVFSSSTGRQLSLENRAWGNGAFTKALIEGLEGRADGKNSGRVTHKMLDYYVSERVKELTQGRQSPVTQAPGGVPDFPVALSR